MTSQNVSEPNLRLQADAIFPPGAYESLTTLSQEQRGEYALQRLFVVNDLQSEIAKRNDEDGHLWFAALGSVPASILSAAEGDTKFVALSLAAGLFSAVSIAVRARRTRTLKGVIKTAKDELRVLTRN
jgi:hypothetical protein